jgi:hypothetical protein
MTLREIVSKLAGIEAKLNAPALNPVDLTAARTELASLTNLCGVELTARDAEIVKLKADATTSATKITELTGQVTAKDAEIVTLKSAAKGAGEQAVAIVAKAGIPAGATPAAEPGDAVNEPVKLMARYHELRAQNPTAAGEFYLKNRDKMFA